MTKLVEFSETYNDTGSRGNDIRRRKYLDVTDLDVKTLDITNFRHHNLIEL